MVAIERVIRQLRDHGRRIRPEDNAKDAYKRMNAGLDCRPDSRRLGTLTDALMCREAPRRIVNDTWAHDCNGNLGLSN